MAKVHAWPTVALTVGMFLVSYLLIILPFIAATVGLFTSLVKSPGFYTAHFVQLTEKGLVEETDLGNQFVRWNGIVKLRKSRWSIQVFIAGNMAHIIPRRAFPDQESFENFFKTCRDRVAAAHTATS